jgi:hypothetical protein
MVGGEGFFAEQLGYPLPMVLDWLFSRQPIPVHVFLRSVDIVLAQSRRNVMDTNLFLEQVRRRNNLPPRDASAQVPSTDLEHRNDIFEWADKFWCFREEYSSEFLRGTDYRVVPEDSEEWKSICNAPRWVG